jgi:chromosome segregation ATPase
MIMAATDKLCSLLQQVCDSQGPAKQAALERLSAALNAAVPGLPIKVQQTVAGWLGRLEKAAFEFVRTGETAEGWEKLRAVERQAREFIAQREEHLQEQRDGAQKRALDYARMLDDFRQQADRLEAELQHANDEQATMMAALEAETCRAESLRQQCASWQTVHDGARKLLAEFGAHADKGHMVDVVNVTLYAIGQAIYGRPTTRVTIVDVVTLATERDRLRAELAQASDEQAAMMAERDGLAAQVRRLTKVADQLAAELTGHTTEVMRDNTAWCTSCGAHAGTHYADCPVNALLRALSAAKEA